MNSILNDVSLVNPELFLNYVVHHVNIKRHAQENLEAAQVLLSLIQVVSSAVLSNNLRQFDQENQPCTVCDKHCHPFDTCPLLQTPADTKQALFKPKTAWRRFQCVIDNLGDQPCNIAARAINTVNAVVAFDLPSFSSVLRGDTTPIINHLTNAVLTNPTAITSITPRFESSVSGVNNNNIADDTSVFVNSLMRCPPSFYI